MTNQEIQDIMKIVHHNIHDISEKTTLGYNGYYQYITWEITSDGRLCDHWLGSNESTKIDDGSTSFQTKIFRDTDFIFQAPHVSSRYHRMSMMIHGIQSQKFPASPSKQNFISKRKKAIKLSVYIILR